MAGGQPLIRAEGTVVEYLDGAAWTDFPFVSGVTGTPAEAPETEIRSFTNVSKLAGLPGVPSVSVTVASYMAHLPAVKRVLEAGQSGELLQWRVRTALKSIGAPPDTTAAIATTGVVTFSGAGTAPDLTSDNYGRGDVISIGARHFIIVSISDTGVAMVVDSATDKAPSGAVAAAAYTFSVPALRLGPFTAAVRSSGGFDLQAGGALSSTIELTPQDQLPHWSIHTG